MPPLTDKQRAVITQQDKNNGTLYGCCALLAFLPILVVLVVGNLLKGFPFGAEPDEPGYLGATLPLSYDDVRRGNFEHVQLFFAKQYNDFEKLRKLTQYSNSVSNQHLKAKKALIKHLGINEVTHRRIGKSQCIVCKVHVGDSRLEGYNYVYSDVKLGEKDGIFRALKGNWYYEEW